MQIKIYDYENSKKSIEKKLFQVVKGCPTFGKRKIYRWEILNDTIHCNVMGQLLSIHIDTNMLGNFLVVKGNDGILAMLPVTKSLFARALGKVEKLIVRLEKRHVCIP